MDAIIKQAVKRFATIFIRRKIKLNYKKKIFAFPLIFYVYKKHAYYQKIKKIEQYVEMVLMFLRLDSDSTDYILREYPLDAIIKQAVIS